MFKIIHERNKCIGCAVCASVCPKYFEMSDSDGLANLKNSAENNGIYELTAEEEINCAKEAADICPVKILKVED